MDITDQKLLEIIIEDLRDIKANQDTRDGVLHKRITDIGKSTASMEVNLQYILSSIKKHDELFYGNGKEGLITRLSKVEQAFEGRTGLTNMKTAKLKVWAALIALISGPISIIVLLAEKLLASN